MYVHGHRGSPGFPRFGENTRTSFRKAISCGAKGLELDVRRCRDGTIVVIHDATIDRTTNGSGRVSDLTYAQLSRFDAGHGDPIPRLSDVLDEFGPICTLHIELKESGIAKDVADMVVERGLTEHVTLSAFDSDDNDKDASSSWTDLASIGSRLPTALLATRRKIERVGREAFIDSARRLGAQAIHPSRDGATPELIDLARQSKLLVRIWTVNNPREALRWRDLGADSIISDRPEACLKALTT